MAAIEVRRNKKRLNTLIIYIVLFSGLLVAAELGSSTLLYAKSTPTFDAPKSFSQLVEMAGPAVVNIRIVKTIKGGGPVFKHFQQDPYGRESPFKDFFERFFGEDMQREFKQPSVGSGFIIDKKGYVVTNNHVIEDADQIRVKLNDDNEFDAEVVGRDANTDLALLKIESDKDLPFIRMGDSDKLKIGQWVVAIGSPFGLERTVTAGIVSAKGRVIGSGPYDDFIQTDASINPGNSGGPLLNMDGKVVGINTAIIASGQGIGFAIPINMAKGIIDQLKEKGEVTRGWLGVGIQDLTPELADYYGLKNEKGVLVTQVFEGDPADKAGIKVNDIILSVDGKNVSTGRELSTMIANTPVGTQSTLDLIRDGKPHTLTVTLAKRDDDEKSVVAKDNDSEEMGIEVTDLDSEVARRFGIDSNENGVLVTDVKDGSLAQDADVRPGDIIKEINRTPVKDRSDFVSLMKKHKEDERIQLLIKRRNAGYVVVNIERK